MVLNLKTSLPKEDELPKFEIELYSCSYTFNYCLHKQRILVKLFALSLNKYLFTEISHNPIHLFTDFLTNNRLLSAVML